jgi:hypothetical protein
MTLVRRPDGLLDYIDDDDDDDVVRDGGVVRKPMMMDGTRAVSDAQRLSDECAANFRAAMARDREERAEYLHWLQNRWRGDDAPAFVADQQPPADLAEGRARVEAAYREHHTWLQNAWRNP